MTAKECQEVLHMIEAIWSFDLGADGRAAWRTVLGDKDAREISEAVLELAKKSPYRPKPADILDVARRRRVWADEQSRRPALPMHKVAVPTWVKRWYYARFVADDRRDFVEQYPHLDRGMKPPHSKDWMPDGLYEEESRVVTDDEVYVKVTS